MAEVNIDDIVTEVRFDNRVSKKSGKSYNVLVVKFDNGYELETFVDKAVQFMINSLKEGSAAK